jgi:hypothetical protein
VAFVTSWHATWWEGAAAAERHHALQQAMIEQRYLPSDDEGDSLRLGGDDNRLVRRGGWTPMSRRVRKRRATIGWRPPTRATGDPDGTHPAGRTWLSVRLRPPLWDFAVEADAGSASPDNGSGPRRSPVRLTR